MACTHACNTKMWEVFSNIIVTVWYKKLTKVVINVKKLIIQNKIGQKENKRVVNAPSKGKICLEKDSLIYK